MIELKFTFASLEHSKAFMAGLGKKCSEALESGVLTATQTESVTPSPAAAAPATAPAATVVPPAVAAGGDSANVLGLPSMPTGLDALLGGTSAAALPPARPAALPPARPAALPPAPPAPPPAPAGQGEPLTQQHVIKAFVALAQNPAKGPSAIKAVLDQLGAATVTAIPADKYDAALAAVRAQLGA